MPNKNITTPATVGVALKQQEAMRLRASGLGLPEIAKRLGYADESGAFYAIKAGLKKSFLDSAEEMRSVQVMRYEAIIAELIGEVLPSDEDKAAGKVPNLRVLDRLLRVFHQLEVVAGLHVNKLAPTDPTGTRPYQPFTTTTEQAANIFSVLASAGIITAEPDQAEPEEVRSARSGMPLLIDQDGDYTTE